MHPFQTLKRSARKLVHKSPGIKKPSGMEGNGRKLGHKKSRSLFSGSFDYGKLCGFSADLSILIVFDYLLTHLSRLCALVSATSSASARRACSSFAKPVMTNATVPDWSHDEHGLMCLHLVA